MKGEDHLVKVTMINGTEYELDYALEELYNDIFTESGILINGFVEIIENDLINPSHIVSIEIIYD